MAHLLEETSTITAKGQTTIPKSVRQALGVDRGGKLAFRVDTHGVSVLRAETEHDDPAIEAFLDFLGSDLTRRPGAAVTLSTAWAKRLKSATEGSAVNLDEAIEGDVSL